MKSKFLFEVTISFLIFAVSSVSAEVIYYNDFEDHNDPLTEWSNTTIDITPIGSRRFLGQFGNESITLTLNDLPSHTYITISFDLLIIRTWDGSYEGYPNGPDIWGLSVVGGPTLLHTTFAHWDYPEGQAFPDDYPARDNAGCTNANEINTLGYYWSEIPFDSVYNLSYSFQHTGNTLQIVFSGNPTQSLDDESWGLDNVKVSGPPCGPEEQVTITFKQDVEGYTGTYDNYISQLYPDEPSAEYPDKIMVDSGMAEHGLLAFTDILGTNQGQIPSGSPICTAILWLNQTNAGDIEVFFHRMLQPWTENDTWNDWSNGIQPDGIEALQTFDAKIPEDDVGPGWISVDVTSSVQAWSDGENNFGWVLLPGENTTAGRFFDTSEQPAIYRPYLVVTYCNALPDANAGDNINIKSSEQLSTNILGKATDPEGNLLEYRWIEGTNVLLDWTNVLPDSNAPLNLGTLPYFEIGFHNLVLEVRELTNIDRKDFDNMILSVDNSPPEGQPAPSYQIIQIGIDPIIVMADVADFDGDTISYKWLKGTDVLDSNSIETIQGGETVSIQDLFVDAGDPRFPLGLHIIDLEVNDGLNEPDVVSVDVNVIDTCEPSLSPLPSTTILWPPNHELKPVTIFANAFDNGGGAITLSAAVVSSEPPDIDGDGNTIPDYYIDSVNSETGEILLRLRSERSGKGDGRTYTITITAEDESGNTSQSTVEIIAPHDKG